MAKGEAGKSLMSSLCPWCNEDINNAIYKEWWEGRDCAVDYETECPSCGQPIQVDITAVPEFNYSKPSPPLTKPLDKPDQEC